jgi:site-specific DNA-methyltransferase (adenine-specific)
MSEGKKEILLGDCLELMKDIPNGSIDMILCDLPYGTTKNKWDEVISFNDLWNNYKRVIKENGAIVLFGSQPFTTDLINSNRKDFRYEIIWDKKMVTGFATCKVQPMKCHENIIVFYSKKPTYNPQLRAVKKPFGKILDGVKSENYGDLVNNGKRGVGYPKTIIEFSKPNNLSKDGNLHPTQKPIGLIEWLVKTYTNENDLVLDNCAGSGTTSIACLNTNRQFIVMEKEQKYYDIILNRVGDFNKNFEPQTLFGNEM